MATPQPIDLSGGFVPLPAPQSAAAPAAATPAKAHGGIDLSGGFVPLSNPAKPAGIDPTSLMDNGLPSQTPGGEGDSQPNALNRMYEVSGLKGIVESAKQKAQEDEDVRTEAMKHVKAGDWGSAAETILGHLAKRAGQGAMGPAGDLIKSSAVNAYAHGKPAVESGIQTVKDIAHGDLPSAELHAADTASEAGQAIPIVGPVAKQIESPAEEDIKNKNWSGLAGDVVGAVPAVLGTAKMGDAAIEGAEIPPSKPLTEIPTSQTIADTKLPLTTGQAITEQQPSSILGSSVTGLENVTKKLPFTGGSLKAVDRAQQSGAREILANKAATTGAEVTNAPEDIEQNFSNAVDKAHEQGSAKYQAIADVADKADLSRPVSSAAGILQDSELAKLLPKSAKDALSKVASTSTEQEQTAQAIYRKSYGELEPEQQTEVGKAMRTAPKPAGMDAVLKARSELASAANSMKDAADRMRAYQALDDFDSATNDALSAHDKANGTNLVSDLSDAKKLWSQKYAFDNFKAGLQQVMRGQPAEGVREIPGQAFQRMINKLDPPGGLKGSRTSTLERMFPDDPQSIKDIHELADFMGKNQKTAGGGMSSAMASMRILGLKESAAAMLTTATGFARLMATPGAVRFVLNALKAGKDTAKLSIVAAQLNRLADTGGRDTENDLAGDTPNPRETQSTNAPNANSDQATTPTTSATPSTSATQTTQNNAIPNATSTAIEAPSGGDKRTTSSRWRTSNSSAPTERTPPASLWANREAKQLTLQGPDGEKQKWVLKDGKPSKVN